MKLPKPGCRAVLLVVCLGLAACGTPPPATLGQTAPPVVTLAGSPGYPGQSLASPNYPGPTVSYAQTPVPPTDLPTPAPGQGTVAGVLYSFTIHAIVQGTLLYLTPAVGPDKRAIPPVITGPSGTPGSVRAQSNDRAQFILTNVPPGNYYLAVAAPLTWDLGASASDEKTPLLIVVQANQTLSLGVIHISWP